MPTYICPHTHLNMRLRLVRSQISRDEMKATSLRLARKAARHGGRMPAGSKVDPPAAAAGKGGAETLASSHPSSRGGEGGGGKGKARKPR